MYDIGMHVYIKADKLSYKLKQGGSIYKITNK